MQLTSQRFHIPQHIILEWLRKYEEKDVYGLLEPNEKIDQELLEEKAIDLEDALMYLAAMLDEMSFIIEDEIYREEKQLAGEEADFLAQSL